MKLGDLLFFPFLAICILILGILLYNGWQTLQEQGPQGAPTYSNGQPVPRDNPFYQLSPLVRLAPAIVVAFLIAAVFSRMLAGSD